MKNIVALLLAVLIPTSALADTFVAIDRTTQVTKKCYVGGVVLTGNYKAPAGKTIRAVALSCATGETVAVSNAVNGDFYFGFSSTKRYRVMLISQGGIINRFDIQRY
jgi:hypothetical protein